MEPDRSGWRWYHVILTTYGAWLPGDPRGFRTRHHRDHVEGDYKNRPPPGIYEGLHRTTGELLKQPPVELAPSSQRIVGKALRDRLDRLEALTVAIAVSSQHIHLLINAPPSEVKTWVGHAKRHAWFELRDQGWKSRLWGKRKKCLPVRGRPHQLNVYRYLLRHIDQGAWVWCLARGELTK